MTREIYLEMTYRHGKRLAGYIHLPRQDGDKAVRSQKAAPGLVVDYASDGRPIGVEITSPSSVSLRAINELLVSLRQQTLTHAELSPLWEPNSSLADQGPTLIASRQSRMAGEGTLPVWYIKNVSLWSTKCNTLTLPGTRNITEEMPWHPEAEPVGGSHH